MDRHNSSDLRSLMESYQTLRESAIDMDAANTPAHVDPKPADPFPKDRVKRDKAEAPKSMKKEDEDLMAAYYAVYDRKAEVVEEEEVAEAMSSYDRNRKRAAQRAADRNAAHAAGKTGAVPGVGYVTPRKERETYVDSAGTTRHKSGAKMEETEPTDFDVILEYLMDRGFPQEDAIQLMATMDDEKRETITSEAVSWDKYGRPKDPKARAEAQRKAAEMRMKDKAAGRRPYGSKVGYPKKDWDE